MRMRGTIVACAGILAAPAPAQVGGCTAATHVSTAGEGTFHSHVAADDGLLVAWRPHNRTVQVYDTTDPENPIPRGWNYVNGVPIGLSLHDGIAVATTRLEGAEAAEFLVFDVSIPSVLRRIARSQADMINATVHGQHVYATTESALRVYRVVNRDAVIYAGQVALEFGSDIAVVDDTAFVLSAPVGDPALVVVDVSDPAEPEVLSRLPLPGLFPLRLAVANSTAYVVIDFNQVWSIDVSDPLNPAVLTAVVSPQSIVDVAARFNALYVMENDPGALHIYDMVDPAAPRWIDAHTPPNEPKDVGVMAGMVVVADGLDGVHLLQLSDCSWCPADLAEPTGVLDYFDVQAFLRLFAERHRATDLDVNAVWDARDVMLWLGVFSEGCP